MNVEQLIKDSALWPGGDPIRRWTGLKQAMQYYQDNFRRKALNECLHQKGRHLQLDAQVEYD